MRVIALDLSMTSTGVCLAEEDPLRVQLRTVKTSPRDGSWMDRAAMVIEAVVLVSPLLVDLIVYEKPIAYGRGNSVPLHLFSGGVLCGLHQVYYDVPMYDVSPSTIKKFWTGSGRAKKADMVKGAHDRGFHVTSDDEADALALALYVLEA